MVLRTSPQSQATGPMPSAKRPRPTTPSAASRIALLEDRSDRELEACVAAVEALRLEATRTLNVRCDELKRGLAVARARMHAKTSACESAAIVKLERGLVLSLHPKAWAASRAEVLSAARSIGFIALGGVASPIVDLFTVHLPIALRFVMHAAEPAWNDYHGRAQWGATLAMFDCKLGRHTENAPTYASLLAAADHASLIAAAAAEAEAAAAKLKGSVTSVSSSRARSFAPAAARRPRLVAPTIERRRLRLTELIARKWCIAHLQRRELHAHLTALEASDGAHRADVWKAIAAGFGPGCAVDCGAFTRVATDKFAVAADGIVVSKLQSADTTWFPAITSVAMAPNTGCYGWTVLIEADPTGTKGFMIGVCSASADPEMRRMYSGDYAKVMSMWGKGYTFGDLAGAQIVGERKWGGASEGDSIGCVLNTDKGVLTVWKNGEKMKTYFAGLSGGVLHAFVSIYRAGSRVRLVPRRP